MDSKRLYDTLLAIPRGRWISYADLARAAGGGPAHARALNRRLQRDRLPNAHRVLCADGSVGTTKLADPGALRRMLEAEGVEFVDGRADAARRLRRPAVRGARAARRASSCTRSETATL